VTTKIRLAVNSDVAAVTDCVCQAFIHYIPRVGKQPGPMLDDYHSLVTQQAVYAHLGYVEFDQRMVNGYDRIFMRKSIL